MLFGGKIRFHDVARLTARYVLFVTICQYSPLFEAIRTIHTIRYLRLFAIRVLQTPFAAVFQSSGPLEAAATAKVCEMVDGFFDCLNVRNTKEQ